MEKSHKNNNNKECKSTSINIRSDFLQKKRNQTNNINSFENFNNLSLRKKHFITSTMKNNTDKVSHLSQLNLPSNEGNYNQCILENDYNNVCINYINTDYFNDLTFEKQEQLIEINIKSVHKHKLTGLVLITQFILNKSPSNILKRNIKENKSIMDIIYTTLTTTDNVIEMKYASDIIVNFSNNYISIREYIYNSNVLSKLNIQLGIRYKHQTEIVSNILKIYMTLFCRSKELFINMIPNLIKNIFETLCDIINEQMFTLFNDEMKSILIICIKIIIQFHYDKILSIPDSVFNLLLTFPNKSNQTAFPDTFSECLDLYYYCVNYNNFKERKEIKIIETFIVKTFPELVNYICLNENCSEEIRTKNPPLQPHDLLNLLKILVVILDHLIHLEENKITIKELILKNKTNLLIEKLISLFWIQCNTKPDIPIELLKVLTILTKVVEIDILFCHINNFFNKLLKFYSKNEKCFPFVILIIKNVLMYHNVDVIRQCISNRFFNTFLLNLLTTSKIENKLNGLNLMLLLIESIRKYNILEYNIKDTFIQFNIIEVLKHIELNSTNPNIIDKTNIILSYITSL